MSKILRISALSRGYVLNTEAEIDVMEHRTASAESDWRSFRKHWQPQPRISYPQFQGYNFFVGRLPSHRGPGPFAITPSRTSSSLFCYTYASAKLSAVRSCAALWIQRHKSLCDYPTEHPSNQETQHYCDSPTGVPLISIYIWVKLYLYWHKRFSPVYFLPPIFLLLHLSGRF